MAINKNYLAKFWSGSDHCGLLRKLSSKSLRKSRGKVWDLFIFKIFFNEFYVVTDITHHLSYFIIESHKGSVSRHFYSTNFDSQR